MVLCLRGSGTSTRGYEYQGYAWALGIYRLPMQFGRGEFEESVGKIFLLFKGYCTGKLGVEVNGKY